MTDEPTGEAKKIIVDDDWKSQVEADKKASETKPPTDEQPEQEPALPPPTLTILATSLYLQGMIAMGLLPVPGADQLEVNLEHAKHAVDTLQMLEKKTEGNRTPEEDKELGEMLHQMHMAFMSIQQQGESQP